MPASEGEVGRGREAQRRGGEEPEQEGAALHLGQAGGRRPPAVGRHEPRARHGRLHVRRAGRLQHGRRDGRVGRGARRLLGGPCRGRSVRRGRRGQRDRQREVVAGRGAQGGQHRRSLGTVARVRREAGLHERQQRGGHRRQVVLAAPDAVHDRHRGAGAERRPPGRGEDHGGGPRVHVGGRRGVVAVEDLGGEVARRAEQPARVGQPRVLGEPGQPEVDEHRGPALEQHVRRLDVAVQHADPVHGDDRLGQAGREVRQVGAGDRPLLADVLVQRQPGDVAGRDVRRLAPGVGVEDLGDPGAGDPAQRRDLPGQPRPGLVVTDDVRAAAP